MRFATKNANDLFALINANPGQTTLFTPIGAQTWLGYAAQLGKLESVKALLEIGIDVNLGDKRDGSRPICSAACGDNFEVVKHLLDSGAELDTSTSLRNALFAAIVGRSPRITKLLLEVGIDSKVRYNTDTMSDMDAVAFASMRGESECAHIVALWNADGNEEEAQLALSEGRVIGKHNAYKRID